MVPSTMMRSDRLRRFNWGRWPFLGLMTILFVLPFIWTILASFNVEADNTVSPPLWRFPPTIDAFREIQEEQTYFWQELATSVLLSATTTLLTIAVAFLAAYALARSPFKYRYLVVQSLLILASLPAVSYMLPLQDMLRSVKLHDTFIGVVLAETGLYAPLVTYILYGYVQQVPAELEESARLDGASLAQVLWQITLPTIASGMMATAVITFVLSWNQFYLPLVLTSHRIKVIPVMLRGFFSLERQFEWPKAAAVIVIALLPVGLFVGVAHRLLERFSLNVSQASE